MKRSWFIGFVAVVVFFAASTVVAGGKNSSKPVAQPESAGAAASEAVRSLADCLDFSGRHNSKGVAADKAEFKRQFGDSVSSEKGATTYNYDKYTKVILNCTSKKCTCSCVGNN